MAMACDWHQMFFDEVLGMPRNCSWVCTEENMQHDPHFQEFCPLHCANYLACPSIPAITTAITPRAVPLTPTTPLNPWGVDKNGGGGVVREVLIGVILSVAVLVVLFTACIIIIIYVCRKRSRKLRSSRKRSASSGSSTSSTHDMEDKTTLVIDPAVELRAPLYPLTQLDSPDAEGFNFNTARPQSNQNTVCSNITDRHPTILPNGRGSHSASQQPTIEETPVNTLQQVPVATAATVTSLRPTVNSSMPSSSRTSTVANSRCRSAEPRPGTSRSGQRMRDGSGDEPRPSASRTREHVANSRVSGAVQNSAPPINESTPVRSTATEAPTPSSPERHPVVPAEIAPPGSRDAPFSHGPIAAEQQADTTSLDSFVELSSLIRQQVDDVRRQQQQQHQHMQDNPANTGLHTDDVVLNSGLYYLESSIESNADDVYNGMYSVGSSGHLHADSMDLDAYDDTLPQLTRWEALSNDLRLKIESVPHVHAIELVNLVGQGKVLFITVIGDSTRDARAAIREKTGLQDNDYNLRLLREPPLLQYA